MAEQLKFEDFETKRKGEGEKKPETQDANSKPVPKIEAEIIKSEESEDECPVGCNTMPCTHYPKGRRNKVA